MSLLLLLALTSCRAPADDDTGGDDSGAGVECSLPDVGDAALGIEGAVVGDDVRDCGRVYLGWSAEDEAGEDATYVYGAGRSVGSDFRLRVDDAPPVEATFDGQAGIAFIAQLPWDHELASGFVDDTSFGGLVGASKQHAVIWRPDGAGTTGTWLDAFPAGLSCGQCEQDAEGQDRLTPVDCDEVQLQTGTLADETPFCEWG